MLQTSLPEAFAYLLLRSCILWNTYSSEIDQSGTRKTVGWSVRLDMVPCIGGLDSCKRAFGSCHTLHSHLDVGVQNRYQEILSA